MAITGLKVSMIDDATRKALINQVNAQACVVVLTTDDALQNGTNLLSAYAEAKSLLPNGEALSATNRATVIVPPGVYHLGGTLDEGEPEKVFAQLVLDTEFVDLIGLTSSRESQYIIGYPDSGETGCIVQTANDVWIENISAKCEITETLLMQILLGGGEEILPENIPNVPAAYFPDDNLSLARITNCEFQGGETLGEGLVKGFHTRALVEYSGTFTNCTGGDGSFGSFVEASGTFTNCTGGEYSFGGGGTASGTFTNCIGEGGSFGGDGGEASGVFHNCTGGEGSFGSEGEASGTFTNCIGGDGSFGGSGTASGTFTNCIGGGGSFGGSGTASGTFHNCTGGDGSFGSFGEASGIFNSCTGGDYLFGYVGTASGTFTSCTGGYGSFGGDGGEASGVFHNCTGGEGSFGGDDGGTLSGQLYYCRIYGTTYPELAIGGKLRFCVDGNDDVIVEQDGLE